MAHPPQGQGVDEHDGAADEGPEPGRDGHGTGGTARQEQQHAEGELEDSERHPVGQAGPAVDDVVAEGP